MNPHRIAFAAALISSMLVVAGCGQAIEPIGSSEGAQRASEGVPVVGEYELDTEARFATLKVKTADASTITFDLETYNKFGANNQGYVTDATARGGNSLYKHTADDCELTFKVASGSIEVEQQGACGMGNGVLATGTFKLKAPTQPGRGPAARGGAAYTGTVSYSFAGRTGGDALTHVHPVGLELQLSCPAINYKQTTKTTAPGPNDDGRVFPNRFEFPMPSETAGCTLKITSGNGHCDVSEGANELEIEAFSISTMGYQVQRAFKIVNTEGAASFSDAQGACILARISRTF